MKYQIEVSIKQKKGNNHDTDLVSNTARVFKSTEELENFIYSSDRTDEMLHELHSDFEEELEMSVCCGHPVDNAGFCNHCKEYGKLERV